MKGKIKPVECDLVPGEPVVPGIQALQTHLDGVRASATPHCQNNRCSPPRETPLWASGLHTSGSPWDIPGSE